MDMTQAQDIAIIESWLNLRDRINICYERMSVEMPQYTELHQMLDYLYWIAQDEEVRELAKIAIALDGIGAGCPVMEGHREGIEAMEGAMKNPIWNLGEFIPKRPTSRAGSLE